MRESKIFSINLNLFDIIVQLSVSYSRYTYLYLCCLFQKALQILDQSESLSRSLNINENNFFTLHT